MCDKAILSRSEKKILRQKSLKLAKKTKKSHPIQFVRKVSSRVNFINMFTSTFYARRSQKLKKLLNMTVFQALLGSAPVKAACKTLVKLTPDVFFKCRPNFPKIKTAPHITSAFIWKQPKQQPEKIFTCFIFCLRLEKNDELLAGK